MEKEFLSQNLCVCVCVSEFWSQNFGPRILSYNQNFVFEKRIFGLIVCNQNFVFGKRNFVPEFCVCVSEFLVFWKKNLFCNRNFEKESFFTCQK